MASNNTTLTEGRLTFAFAQHCNTVVYDASGGWFNQNFKKAQGRKAMDFLIFDPNLKRHWWFEIKDFAQDPASNAYRLGDTQTTSLAATPAKPKQLVWDEFTTKFADTLLGLWVSKSETQPALSPYDQVVSSQQNLTVVLVITWLFRGVHLDMQRKRMTSLLLGRLKHALVRYGRQLTAKVVVLDPVTGHWR